MNREEEKRERNRGIIEKHLLEKMLFRVKLNMKTSDKLKHFAENYKLQKVVAHSF